MGVENRKNQRVPFTVDVLINNAVLVKGIDISITGLYLHTGRSFPPGSIIDVSFPLNTIRISLKAKVQHNQSGVGMGIQFVDLQENHAALIRRFIETFDHKSHAQKPAKKKVLLIDEDERSRRMNKSKMVMEGFTVLEVGNGMDAMEVLQQESPDIIILDVIMEKIDGFKVLDYIKKSPMGKETPVIIFSSKGTPEIREKAMNAGAKAFLLKMMTTPVKLAATVKELLN